MRSLYRQRRRMQRFIRHLALQVNVYWHRVLVGIRTHKGQLYPVAGLIVTITLGVGIAHRFYPSRASAIDVSALSRSGIVSQLGIAVAAAMLGVIGIVFSLSIFSIQQVAERGTSLTLREYAEDWVLRAVYWCLGIFTLLATISAILKDAFAGYALMGCFVILIAAILLLKLYFNRAIRFSDPHFTISKIARRARKDLANIQRTERAVELEIRYARRRGRP